MPLDQAAERSFGITNFSIAIPLGRLVCWLFGWLQVVRAFGFFVTAALITPLPLEMTIVKHFSIISKPHAMICNS